MRKTDASQAIVVLANLGVIVGILLLVYELNQNSVVARAQLRSEYAQMLIGQVSDIYGDAELAEILFDGECNEIGAGLCDTVDEFRYNLYWRGRFRAWENLHYQYRAGLYDEDEYSAARESWRNLLSIPRVAENWRAAESIYSPEFVDAMNDLSPE